MTATSSTDSAAVRAPGPRFRLRGGGSA